MSGIVPTLQTNYKSTCQLNLKHTRALDQQLRKFWSLEDFPNQKTLSPDELICESHFANTVHRTSEGRYVVSLPRKPNMSLGLSKKQATHRFYQVEHRLHKDEKLLQQYSQFMSEYEALGHMELVEENVQPPVQKTFYLPHQAVFKPDSITTKLRVVFDASMKSSSVVSLNDTLYVGPVVQPDIFAILTRFRIHNFVLTGDIEKMYRQFLLTPDERDLQRILWRSD